MRPRHPNHKTSRPTPGGSLKFPLFFVFIAIALAEPSYANIGKSEAQEAFEAKGAALYGTHFCNYILHRLTDPKAPTVGYDNAEYLLQLNRYRSGELKFEYSEVGTNGHTPLRDTARESGPLTEADFDSARIPAEMRKHYDRQTGAFRYATESPRLLAVENGEAKLDAIRINYSDNAPLRKLLLKDYRRALENLPGVELWIAHRPKDKAELRGWISALPREMRKRVRLFPVDIPITVTGAETQFFEWSQDAAKPLRRGRATLVPPTRRAEGVQARPDYFAAIEGMEKAGLAEGQPSPFPLQGGNLVVGERHVFVGTKLVQEVMATYRVTRPEALAALTAEFGQPVLELGVPDKAGAAIQPVFHIDMSLAVAKDRKRNIEVVLLDSPRTLFEDVLKLPPLDTLSQELFRAKLREFVAEKYKDPASGKKRSWTFAEKQFLESLIHVPLDAIRMRMRQTEMLAAQLKGNGYEVRETPGFTQLLQGTLGESLDIFNYTNAIFSGNKAISPVLGIDFLDQAAHKITQELGYETIPMRSSDKFFCFLGGPRCAAETFRRPPPR